jgi:Cof subfamily protein (haloacid dehalogenase superfamily)
MNIKLIGIDLDGTALRNDKTISPFTRHVIEDAIKSGITVVPVTGRPVSGLPDEFMNIAGIKYAVTCNGASAYSLEDGSSKVLFERHIPLNEGMKILYTANDIKAITEVFINGFGYMTYDNYNKRLTERHDNPPLLSYIKASRRPVENLDAFIENSDSDIEGICIQCATEKERDLVNSRLFSFENMSIVLPSPTEFEITHRLANKGDALLCIGKMLGLNKDNIMAVGDSDNDSAMLKAVGFPVAMGNATARIKAVARYITDDNEHDGVGKAIKEIFNFPTQP